MRVGGGVETPTRRSAARSRGSMTPRTLPDWFKANRVKGHTRLSFSGWYGTDEFAHAAAGFKALGAGAFTRHVKTSEEDPWPREVWQALIDEAHAEGLHVVGYYWHQTEKSQNDDEALVCKQPNGMWIDNERGYYLDITGPYGETVLERLQKLADLGVDGLMFDERHLPPIGTWGSALEVAWRDEMNEPPPPAIDDADERYRRYIDFKARRIEDTFAHWLDAVKTKHPDIVFIVSTTTIPALTDREMTTRLARIADSSKNEYRLALNPNLNKHVFDDDLSLAPADHVRQAIGWTVLRDAADARPPQIWVSGVPDKRHALGAAGSLLTFGCIANMDVDEPSILGNNPPRDGKTPLDALEAAFDLGRRTSPYLADAQPVRWAAVHFPERARNDHDDRYREAWEQVLWPLVGAFQALSEDGFPVGIVNDHQLERGALAGYRVLVLPTEDLTPAQQQAVTAFRTRGGIVLKNDPAWGWADPGTRDAAFAGFRRALQQRLAAPPLYVPGKPDGCYSVAYLSGGRLVVAVTNDFRWVQITNRRNVPNVVNDPAPSVSGVEASWRKGHGLPETWDWLPFPRLRAFDAVTGRKLTVDRFRGGYRVRLPEFRFMALLVVERVVRPYIPQTRGRTG